MLFALNLWGAIWWGLLFATAYMKRRELQRNGTGELDQAIAYSANMGQDDFSPAPSESRRPQRDRRAERQAAADQALQKKVDSILDKVRDHGMASLNRREQRTLKEATERERRRLATPRKRP
jgi:hypothetical protein